MIIPFLRAIRDPRLLVKAVPVPQHEVFSGPKLKILPCGILMPRTRNTRVAYSWREPRGTE
jgi:hypothetical protein